jgi:hypothetical protein
MTEQLTLAMKHLDIDVVLALSAQTPANVNFSKEIADMCYPQTKGMCGPLFMYAKLLLKDFASCISLLSMDYTKITKDDLTEFVPPLIITEHDVIGFICVLLTGIENVFLGNTPQFEEIRKRYANVRGRYFGGITQRIIVVRKFYQDMLHDLHLRHEDVANFSFPVTPTSDQPYCTSGIRKFWMTNVVDSDALIRSSSNAIYDTEIDILACLSDLWFLSRKSLDTLQLLHHTSKYLAELCTLFLCTVLEGNNEQYARIPAMKEKYENVGSLLKILKIFCETKTGSTAETRLLSDSTAVLLKLFQLYRTELADTTCGILFAPVLLFGGCRVGKENLTGYDTLIDLMAYSPLIHGIPTAATDEMHTWSPLSRIGDKIAKITPQAKHLSKFCGYLIAKPLAQECSTKLAEVSIDAISSRVKTFNEIQKPLVFTIDSENKRFHEFVEAANTRLRQQYSYKSGDVAMMIRKLENFKHKGQPPIPNLRNDKKIIYDELLLALGNATKTVVPDSGIFDFMLPGVAIHAIMELNNNPSKLDFGRVLYPQVTKETAFVAVPEVLKVAQLLVANCCTKVRRVFNEAIGFYNRGGYQYIYMLPNKNAMTTNIHPSKPETGLCGVSFVGGALMFSPYISLLYYVTEMVEGTRLLFSHWKDIDTIVFAHILKCKLLAATDIQIRRNSLMAVSGEQLRMNEGINDCIAVLRKHVGLSEKQDPKEQEAEKEKIERVYMEFKEIEEGDRDRLRAVIMYHLLDPWKYVKIFVKSYVGMNTEGKPHAPLLELIGLYVDEIADTYIPNMALPDKTDIAEIMRKADAVERMPTFPVYYLNKYMREHLDAYVEGDVRESLAGFVKEYDHDIYNVDHIRKAIEQNRHTKQPIVIDKDDITGPAIETSPEEQRQVLIATSMPQILAVQTPVPAPAPAQTPTQQMNIIPTPQQPTTPLQIPSLESVLGVHTPGNTPSSFGHPVVDNPFELPDFPIDG